MRSGVTVPELVVVLALMGIAGTALLPAARAASDRLAVVAAREVVAELLARTRTEAMLAGGAVLRLRALDGRVWVQASDSASYARSLTREFGVTVDVGRSGEAELVFDALGIGRRASQTVVLRRGKAESRLVVAAYGRGVRR